MPITRYEKLRSSSTLPSRISPRPAVPTVGGQRGAFAAELGLAGFGRCVAALGDFGLQCFAGPAERNAFLAQSDILVCLLPDTLETRGVLNAEALSRLPRAAGLINVARGSHLIMCDLIDTLDRGQLAGAFLDVFEAEPLPSSDPAGRHPRIVVTPHTGSLASRCERASYAADIIARL